MCTNMNIRPLFVLNGLYGEGGTLRVFCLVVVFPFPGEGRWKVLVQSETTLWEKNAETTLWEKNAEKDTGPFLSDSRRKSRPIYFPTITRDITSTDLRHYYVRINNY